MEEGIRLSQGKASRDRVAQGADCLVWRGFPCDNRVNPEFQDSVKYLCVQDPCADWFAEIPDLSTDSSSFSRREVTK